ncbi:hypothetical protein [Microvirga makkahensis]|uniref:Uncharacterized protein n=1 Tax=Microvirga makkahensis TaxID=1128670 RepID=A0A7X3MUG1_9HYPH|nr:hypothetical protein [Microvirga makkahensis]MXQ13335.1 hypothetical protein [Microvirga makkahensis]
MAPVVANAGTEVILFDTGISADGLIPALEAAGLKAKQVVALVVLTRLR